MNQASDCVFAATTSEQLIGDEPFRALIRARSRPLLEVARGLTASGAGSIALTGRLSGRLLLEAGQMEDLLDEYGASQNRHWSHLRALVAALRNFARIGQALAHVQRRLPTYRLPLANADFHAATGERQRLVGGVVTEIAAALLTEARQLGVDIADSATPPEDDANTLPPGRLARTRDERSSTDAATIVTHLATAFFNLAARSELLRSSAQVAPQDYAHCFPDPVSEERLRQLSFRFHNLQSLYDTHVSGTALETLDPDLSILRGHASVIHHLLNIATDLAHYYERHLSPETGDSLLRERPVVDGDAIMATLFAYAMAFSSDFLDGGQRLSQNILRRYADAGRLEVPVPSYRGFHVRPSNLVARIVAHYGSEVQMDLDGKRFDASSPLDIFRANETINARKRHWLATEIARVDCRRDSISDPSAIAAAVLDIVHRLAAEGKMILYRQPLELSDEIGHREGGVFENTIAEITRLQATAQLDIRTDLSVTFIGDKRVLCDVDTLARAGYGEDAFGNNVVLPKALSYLRR